MRGGARGGPCVRAGGPWTLTSVSVVAGSDGMSGSGIAAVPHSAAPVWGWVSAAHPTVSATACRPGSQGFTAGAFSSESALKT